MLVEDLCLVIPHTVEYFQGDGSIIWLTWKLKCYSIGCHNEAGINFY